MKTNNLPSINIILLHASYSNLTTVYFHVSPFSNFSAIHIQFIFTCAIKCTVIKSKKKKKNKQSEEEHIIKHPTATEHELLNFSPGYCHYQLAAVWKQVIQPLPCHSCPLID